MHKMVVERERLQDKYFYALKLFFANEDFKSQSVFESFKILVDVRNAIVVHNKLEVMVTGGAVSKPNIDLKSHLKFIQQLKSKRVISKVDGSTSWVFIALRLPCRYLIESSCLGLVISSVSGSSTKLNSRMLLNAIDSTTPIECIP